MQPRQHGSACTSKLRLLTVLAILSTVAAQPASLPFVDCSTADEGSAEANQHITISAVYAQIASYQDPNPVLKYTIIGETAQPIQGATPKLLATLFETSSVLTFAIDESAGKFCERLRAPSSSVAIPDNTNCTIPPGPVAFSASTPYRHDFRLTTIATRIRAVDASSPPVQLACVDVSATPVSAQGNGGYYGRAQVLFWMSVGLAIAYWFVIGAARIAAAWDRGGSGRRAGWLRIKWAGTVLSSALSGERLSASPALLRFSTPSMRDIIFHTQWCAGLAMVAVQWPGFAYPVLRNAAWATLIYNVTLIQGSNADTDHWDSTRVANYNPPQQFLDQMSDPNSPLYLNAAIENQLFLLPDGTKEGIRSFAYTVGIRPQDLFGTCLAIYLAIVAATVVISCFIWFSDWLISSAMNGGTNNSASRKQGAKNHRHSVGSEAVLSKDIIDSPHMDDGYPGSLPPPTARFAATSRKAWWNYRLGQSSFHRNILYGNLVRILILFHVPITLYSCFQFSLGRPDATIVSMALAGLAFTFLSLLLPALLLYRLAITSTGKLYEATRTLLSLGPLYYHYSPGQQRFAYLVFAHNLMFGIVVGAGQGSGTAQAIVLLIIEVFAALGTSMWLPWGEGAHMGAMSFMFCVGRIITCVLLVILSPVVNVGYAAAGWIAYAIFIINGLIYLAFGLMLVAKVIEGIVRLAGHLPFDKSRHSADSGVVGVIGMLACCGSRKRRRSRRHQYRPSHTNRVESGQGTATSATHMIPPNRPPYQLGNMGTTTSVPSYLRPEQASTPYREDGDDPDGGYILGAFHDDYHPPQPANPTHTLAVSQQPPPTTTTGFTRVKGGRANFENPFSIRADNLPSPSPSNQQRRPQNRSPDSPTSPFLPSAYSQIATSGAPAPSNPRLAHGRKKSETAVIEDVSIYASASQTQFVPPSPSAYRGESPLPPPAVFATDDDYSTDSSVKPRRKFWFSGKSASDPAGDESDAGHESDQAEGVLGRWPWRRARNKSEPESMPSASVDAPGAKSFSVVRPQRPPQSRPGAETVPSSWRRPSTAPDHGEDEQMEMSTPQTPRASTWSRRQSSPYS